MSNNAIRWLLAACAAAATIIHPGELFGDAISREFTVQNDLTAASLSFSDSISREFTVFVEDPTSNNVNSIDSISREFTILNDLSTPPTLTVSDAISREFTLLNNTVSVSLTFADANSRELSIYFRLRCDLNCDDKIDGRDVQIFTLALLNPAQYPTLFPTCLIATADTNNNGAVEPADVPGFVACLLTSGP